MKPTLLIGLLALAALALPPAEAHIIIVIDTDGDGVCDTYTEFGHPFRPPHGEHYFGCHTWWTGHGLP